MFRRAINQLSPSIRIATLFHSSLRPLSTGSKVDELPSLLAAAEKAKRSGEIAKAQKIYEQVIEQHPKEKTGYQELFNLWANYFAHQVPQKKWDDFMEKYKENFEKEDRQKTQPDCP
jgi:hypothetical protein